MHKRLQPLPRTPGGRLLGPLLICAAFVPDNQNNTNSAEFCGSVRANLLTTKISNGIIGNFSFNKNGDTTVGAVTIYRIANGRPQVARVLTPPPNLLDASPR
jgi:hypothetical protein